MQNSFVERVDYFATVMPDHVAVTAEEKSITYREYSELSKKTASFLLENGLKKGDRVICRSAQCVEFLILYSALLRIGGVMIAVEFDCPTAFIYELKRDYGVKCIFGIERDGEENKDLLFWQLKDLCGLVANVEIRELELPDHDVEAQIAFTTGSTGKRKGVIIPESRSCEGEFTGKIIGYDKYTVCYLFAPVNHQAFFGYASAILFYGGRVIIAQKLTNLKDFIYALETCKANALQATPSVYNYWTERFKDLLDDFSDQIKIITMTGESLPLKTLMTLNDVFKNAKVFTFYGTTETGVITGKAVTAQEIADRCVGELTDDGIEVKTEDERIYVSSPYTMLRYTDGERVTEKYIATDDRGYIKDGKLYVLGRMSDIIISGGHKIDPLEVENAAKQVDTVKDCVCVGAPDDNLGNIIKLYVEWNLSADGVDRVAMLKKSLTAMLEGYKIPHTVISVESIKKNDNGKTDRKFYKANKEN